MGQGRPIRLMVRLSTRQRQIHPSRSRDRNTREGVYTMAQQWRMVRLPVALAERLDRLAEQTERNYREGRVELPAEYADHCPLWLVVERLANEVESRRVRSNRPRRRKQPV
jgi:hypothetical protein